MNFSSLHPISLPITPFKVAERCAALPGFVFFDTALQGEGGEDRYSILAAYPSEIIRGASETAWRKFRKELRSATASGEEGFAAGWVEYDGAFCFGFFEDFLVYRHGPKAGWYAAQEESLLLRALERVLLIKEGFAPLSFTSNSSREEFIAQVERAQEYIAAGDIYQVNLSHQFSARWKGNPFALYTALRRCSPAPYAAFLQLGKRSVLSSSPELFLRIDGRTIITRPIKGTRPRRPDQQEDEKSAQELLSSPKEAAELVMITDLERNDLGQICEFGSVEVTSMLALERFEQVFHLVSTVEGRLREGIDPVEALRACFPGGSITGAPKKRAREIIAELESAPRGLYTGAIGYFDYQGGGGQFNIAIRTVVIEKGRATFGVGAGIVADSVPSQEWEETLAKAQGILLAAAGV